MKAGRIVVTGADGMLGRAFRSVLSGRHLKFDAYARSQLDVTDSARVHECLKGASLVVNCAAYTSVDAAEAHLDEAMRVNAHGVELLAEECRHQGALLVHFSTDYVFDGSLQAPLAIDAPRAPLNAYGRSKAHGEDLLLASRCPHLLVRTSWVYASWGRSFVLTMARLLRERTTLRVVTDQRSRPTSAEWLAQATLELALGNQRGTFHVTDGGECSRYELSLYIARLLASRCAIEPCPSAEFPSPARRPEYSVLDISKAERTLGPFPSFEENVKLVLTGEGPARGSP